MKNYTWSLGTNLLSDREKIERKETLYILKDSQLFAVLKRI